MDAFFERVLQISLSGSVIVLAVLALRLVLKNENATVTALISREEAQTSRVEELVEQTFGGKNFF